MSKREAKKPSYGHDPANVDESLFSQRLVDWYRERARDLPWRRTRDPYPIWVSEIMLQQTRVETVIPYFERFLEEFPTLESLASADSDDVVARWSGLGYYSRARNLHKGAGFVMERHGGRFPETREAALEVPGIGPYTSAAILSIAYGKPHAVVDGNVIRVLARLYRLEPPEDRRVPSLETLAGTLMGDAPPADFNQAMMELGATVCRPRQPECGICPVREFCEAHNTGDPERFPFPKKKPELEFLEFALFLVRSKDNHWLLEKGAWPHIPHLWLPPIVTAGDTEEAGDAAWSRWLRSRKTGSLGLLSWEELGSFKHSVTHRRMTFRVFETVCEAHDDRLTHRATSSRVLQDRAVEDHTDEVGAREGISQKWVPTDAIGRIGHSSILKKALSKRNQLSLGLPRGDRG